MLRTMFRAKSRAICLLLAIGLLIPAMPVAAVAAGHTLITQGIAGYVTTGMAPGTPVAGATVTVWTTAVPPVLVATTTSDSEGFYEIQLPAGDYYVEFEAEGYFGQFYNGVGDIAEATVVTVAEGQILEFVELMGPDRYGTAIAVSQESHPIGADAVIIARGDRFPDALAGASLAGLHNAPILLTRTYTLPAAVATEIDRLDPSHIYILGETLAVSAAVEAELAAMVGAANITRFGGQTRYDTAIEIAEHVIAALGEGYDGTAFVATGGRFPDALSASPIMAAQHIPLFLAHPTAGLTAATKAAMEGTVSEAAFIVGGPLAVGNEVEDELEDMIGEANVERVEGADRYATAVAVAEFGVTEYGHVWEGVGIATGQRFPDSLTGGPYQGQLGSVMVLTRTASLPTVTAAALEAHNDEICELVNIYGGTLAISSAVRAHIMAIITPCLPIVWVDATLVSTTSLAGVLATDPDGRFTTLLAAAEIAGLDAALADSLYGPVTLFAPTNDAFAALQAEIGQAAWDALLADPAALLDVLLYHLLSGEFYAADVVAGITAADPDLFVLETLLAGAYVSFTDTGAGVFINDSEIIEFDIGADNGVIHVIDAVLLPAPAIQLEKAASTELAVTVGDEIIYTYKLTNTGSWMLDGPFSVVDDKFMEPIEIDPVLWAELEVGASVEVTASYMVTIADVLAGTVTNEAHAVGWYAGVEVLSVPVSVVLEAEAEGDVLLEVFGMTHHHLTIPARDILTEAPVVAPLDESDVCIRLLNRGALAVDVDVMLDLSATTLDAQWWYEASPGVWVDAAATGILSLTLDPNVAEEVCFYVFFEDVPGEYSPFYAAIEVYEAGTANLLKSTTLEVSLSASGGS